MEIIRGISHFDNSLQQCVMTLGNFDGVHLGHQALIANLQKIAKAKQLPTVVMIFEPQPLEFFDAENAPSRLTSFREKCIFLEQLGVDYLLPIAFNQTFTQLSAHDFIEHYLINKLHAQYIIIGDDFRFGSQRQGDAQLLQQYATDGYFGFQSMPTYIAQGHRVSSTLVRQALLASDFGLAKALLGRDYTLQGRVVHGNQLARQMGFPTANIHLNRKKPALHGVYFVKVENRCSGSNHYGIANIGIRPTINDKVSVLEVNIFDFAQTIYGDYLAIQFIEKIRDEQKFSSLDALKTQITQDICIAREIKAKF